MIIKIRKESVELKLYRYLNIRTKLSDKERNYYMTLEKGYQGELMFDAISEPLSTNWLIINDLMLEYNHTVFQIDTLLISTEKIFIFEIKNYEGDYFLKDDKWYTLSKTEIRNPLHQVERSESIFRRLLQELGITIPIETCLIFVNPEFYLYQASLDLPIIFPTQLNRFIKQLSKYPAKYKDNHLKLAKQLVSMHVEKSPYLRLPDYSYDELKKGITCVSCHSFNVELKGNVLICKECKYKERITSALLRGVEEFTFLFPDRKITTNDMMEWFKVIESRITMRRLLAQNFKQMGRGKYTYYVKL
ncbi:nuclease-related domain-containing protein [Bacillus sp. DTU_2020_1000418_1_SI_GHA_SEK_038]|uniref:nuclease-related domain-containing protein n=1 Tax=Bacillus sp. DTU_2020_1000418_1_SI_GHA_SEK_038 TaxID=3077585 RepID=UPI0028EEB412|nr:nuclease-related domain-containing protein [Bacillus sp. DTU_2020_1000418_1_SI_GHA_SEK_038]WNS75269.1 nuclease-related domain-containing protein [Bacillus sp. DTU_2020_1000418_1_SI_GHA_SEK_038]